MEPNSGSTFGTALRAWRSERRLSQADLAGDIQTTTRHLSFLETGRSHPSKEMVFRLAAALDIPFRERNGLLRAAGFADVYAERALSDEVMASVMSSIDRIMDAHDPYPSFLLDRYWRIRKVNGAARRMLSLAGAADLIGGPEAPTVFDLTFDRNRLRPLIRNWEDYARQAIQRLLRESMERREATSLLARLRSYEAIPEDWWAFDASHLVTPIMPIELAMNGNLITLFSMVTSIGTPTDITAQELRIESMFPADDDTAHLLAG